MPKLRLKRTPAEDAERQLRRAQRAARRAAKRPRSRSSGDDDGGDDDGASPQSRPTFDAEEERFAERLFAAYEDDNRLFALGERLNDYAHVPHRWRSSADDGRKSKRKGRREEADGDDDDDDDAMLDPQCMSDEQYAEWVRVGMWRSVRQSTTASSSSVIIQVLAHAAPQPMRYPRSLFGDHHRHSRRRRHAAEYEEQCREQARMEARRAREEAIKAETARLAQRAEEERRRKKRERAERRWADAREEYDTRWKQLSSGRDGAAAQDDGTADLRFDDIPWPIVSAQPATNAARKRPEHAHALAVEDLTEAAISAFLLQIAPTPGPDTQQQEVDEVVRKERKERLREAMLRFHPDKFEGRLLKRVRLTDREKVTQGVGQVVRVLNALMVKNDTR